MLLFTLLPHFYALNHGSRMWTILDAFIFLKFAIMRVGITRAHGKISDLVNPDKS